MRKSVSSLERLWDKDLPSVNQTIALGHCLASDVADTALHLSDIEERNVPRTLLFVEAIEVRGPAELLVPRKDFGYRGLFLAFDLAQNAKGLTIADEYVVLPQVPINRSDYIVAAYRCNCTVAFTITLPQKVANA